MYKIKENDHNMILLYSQQKTGLRHKCDLCDYPVSYSENKLLACTNKKGGVIYKDIMDEGPEWRYYGADDTKSSDPTRCGMPINVLLPDSSVGSIILNQYSNDKNMNQIKITLKIIPLIYNKSLKIRH